MEELPKENVRNYQPDEGGDKEIDAEARAGDSLILTEDDDVDNKIILL